MTKLENCYAPTNFNLLDILINGNLTECGFKQSRRNNSVLRCGTKGVRFSISSARSVFEELF